MESVKSELFEYVKDNTFKETETLDADTKLFVEGIFDSMGFALLIDFLEDKFNIVANDDDLVEKNFETINAIAQFIQTKKSAIIQ